MTRMRRLARPYHGRSPIMNFNDQNRICHAERSEASLGPASETLRCAHGDNTRKES
jgi:hypothetical protein